MRRWWIALLAALAGPWCARAGEVTVAVAANFTQPAKALAQMLRQTTGHAARLSFGATGAFTTQIANGAPFDVLLAADNLAVARLWKEGRAAAAPVTYAIGRLALWSAQPGLVDARGAVLDGGRFDKLAIANPKLAPYGAAAMQTLQALGLAAQVAPKLVTGENIGQTYQFVASGNAQLGFIALSQAMRDGEPAGGSLWVVPENLHAPIVQDAVLLQRGADNPAARAWMELLRSPAGQALIRGYGYGVAGR
jgi:molybdate transport system substrate-binding protein